MRFRSGSNGKVDRYKVQECSPVTDEELERVINERVRDGYLLDGIHFVVREASKRPSMAFVLFTKPEKGRREKSR
jgi:hypothetical protein